MQGRMNLPVRGGGGGGEGIELNVFAQSTEPTTKEGIWINTSASGSLPGMNKFEYEGIEMSTNYDTYNRGSFVYEYERMKDIPYDFYYGSAVAIGTYVYLFGGYPSPYYNYAYKYDTLTGTYTQLRNIPYVFYCGSAVAVGTDVYLFGSYYSSYYKYAYKYDTLTGTYTQLRNIPYDFYCGSAVAVGTDVYLFGGGSDSTSRKYAYKYNLPVIEDPKNNYIYLYTNYVYRRPAKISDNIILPILYAAICQNATLLKYPAYYGDGTQWIQLPS